MKKEVLKKSTLGGILWTLMIGTLSHFFYQWSGENFFVGLLSPVNETIWEHLSPKIAYVMLSAKLNLTEMAKKKKKLRFQTWRLRSSETIITI